VLKNLIVSFGREIAKPRRERADRALHGTGAGSAAQRVGLKRTSWREQDVLMADEETKFSFIN
jgi:hypothetical protein